MTRERKRGLSLILAILMLFVTFSGSLGTAAYAEEVKTEEAAPAVEEAPKAEEAAPAEAPAEEKAEEEPEVVVDVAVLGEDKAEEAKEEAPAEEVKEEKKEEKPEAKTVTYKFIGLDGKEVKVIKVKTGEEVKAPDYKPGEIKWVYKGTETVFVNGPAGKEDKEIVAVEKTAEEIEAEAKAAEEVKEEAEAEEVTVEEPEAEAEAEAAAAEEPKEENTEPEEIELTLNEKVALLAPTRSLTVTADLGEGELYFGDEVTMTATLNGYDKLVYTIQWQSSTDNENWNNVSGENGETMTVTCTEDNYLLYWRAVVTITGVTEEPVVPAAEVPAESVPEEAEVPADEG